MFITKFTEKAERQTAQAVFFTPKEK